ncbi:MAG: serine/threonine protein kinase [Cellulomonadaceae bacterium]|jgi:RIO kinase 1|nr:serine/threonine protein kinase [Cellulomonadaceae bacterium]
MSFTDTFTPHSSYLFFDDEPPHYPDPSSNAHPSNAADALGDADIFADPELHPDIRWSTWPFVEKLQRGPQPYPVWLVTEAAALDTELGILKTGKEADVHLIERAVPGDPHKAVQLAAKRYRSADDRAFRRDSSYTEGRKVKKSRDQRAITNRKSEYGRAVKSGAWAWAEFSALSRLYTAGAPVPYPVQIDDTEILMEFIGEDGVAAPRLAQARPSAALLQDYWHQLRTAMGVFARLGWAHGDLSPYNTLAHGDRLVIIDVPQVVDLAASPFATQFLHRDCVNMCTWFNARGLNADPDVLFAEVLAEAW